MPVNLRNDHIGPYYQWGNYGSRFYFNPVVGITPTIGVVPEVAVTTPGAVVETPGATGIYAVPTVGLGFGLWGQPFAYRGALGQGYGHYAHGGHGHR